MEQGASARQRGDLQELADPQTQFPKKRELHTYLAKKGVAKTWLASRIEVLTCWWYMNAMAARYSALDIANWLLAAIDRDAGDSITHLKLQKLIYYAQAWSLALPNRGDPLFDEDMQAWAHGPVAESVFKQFKGNAWDALPAPEQIPDIAEEDVEHISEILSVFGEFSAKQLERMTHNEDPWLFARGDLPPEARSNNIISKEHMAKFYRELYEKVEDGEPGSA